MEYYYERYNTTRSDWKVFGDVDIFQLHNVLAELVNKMTINLPKNVKLQVSLVSTQNDRINQTKLLSKHDMANKLADWVNFFIDYQDMSIEDITFKLLAIEIPQGSGKRVLAIITADAKRSIIQVRNYDTICLARAIVVGLAANNREKLEEIFTSNLTITEQKEFNKGRLAKNLTQIHNGQ